MNEPAPCGRPGCPVPEHPPGRGLRTVVWEPETRLRRGHKKHHGPSALVPGVGDTRFAPLDGTAHVYLATTSFAALLESALHDASPAAPRIASAVLALWAEAEVSLTEQVRLIDLRDPALARLGLGRDALVATSAAHYPCTRRFARRLHGRVIGGHVTHGLVWHSRQAELHTAAMTGRPAVKDLLDHRRAEVAVVWSPPAAGTIVAATGDGIGDLADGDGRRYVADLSALLGIVTM